MPLQNKSLYEQLVLAFKRVEIASKGEAMTGTYVADWTGRGPRKKLSITQWGESYRVSCPFCSDTRCRLWISHRWSETDYDNDPYNNNLHLATCFNECCLSTRENQKKLHAIVYPNGIMARELGPIQTFVTASVVATCTPITLPTGMPIATIAADHPARHFLVGRGFDLEVLSKTYGVLLAGPDNSTKPPLISPRIIVPFFAPESDDLTATNTRLVGWQARAVGETSPSERCKYLTATGMQKSKFLYNLPQAVASAGPVAVVEGVLDAWKVGVNAVALLGKTISEQQCNIITRHLVRRPIVVVLDADAAIAAAGVAEKIRAVRLSQNDFTKVVVGCLPGGRKDPGECTTKELDLLVRAATRAKQ